MQIRRLIYTALLAGAGIPFTSAAKDGAATVDPPPPPPPKPGTPASSSLSSPTKTSSTTAASSSSSSTNNNNNNNNPNLLGSLFRASRELGVLGCVPQLLPLATSLPRDLPPELLGADLLGQALAQTTLALDEVCAYAVTGTAGAAFSSFLPAWYAWYDGQADRVRRLVEKCPKVGALTRTAEAYRTCGQVREIMSSAAAAAAEQQEARATATAEAKVEVVEEEEYHDEKMEL